MSKKLLDKERRRGWRTKQDAKLLAQWMAENNAKPSVKYDEDTGEPQIVFTIDLRK